LPFPSLTVEENVRLASTLGKTAGSSRSHRASADHDVFDDYPELQPLRKKRSGLLSGGQGRLLGLAMLSTRAPKLLLLDEPTAGLPPFRGKSLLKSLAVGKTSPGIVLVEQNVGLAATIADRCVLLREGTLIEVPRAVQAREEDLIDMLIGSTGESVQDSVSAEERIAR
jgi:ABC-type branched-subunit amino acid transport system ATPase component